MQNKISQRLLDIAEALPLRNGIRVLEIGCGPGVLAREICNRIGNGHVMAIDRSSKAIEQAISGSKEEIESGRLTFKQIAIEDFELPDNIPAFDLAVAIRVGALDGRHPEIEKQALEKIAKALMPTGKMYIDGSSVIKEIALK